jgi:hypothetical protein
MDMATRRILIFPGFFAGGGMNGYHLRHQRESIGGKLGVTWVELFGGG